MKKKEFKREFNRIIAYSYTTKEQAALRKLSERMEHNQPWKSLSERDN